MYETSISHDHVSFFFFFFFLLFFVCVSRIIRLKVGEKEDIMSQPMQDRGISLSG